MHDDHKHHTHGHTPESGQGNPDAETQQKLLVMLEHWIEHGDSHAENYREWAVKASGAGEEEIAREIHLAIDDNESVRSHLKRAKDILAAKLVLRK